MGKKREAYLDVAKFLAIYLVVVHHVRDYAGNPAVYAGMPGLENLSSVFNVAVFFAISGYLSRGLMERHDVGKLVRHQVAYLWPLLPVVLGGGACVCLATSGTLPVLPNGWLRTLFSVGWFFFCLSTCEIATFAAFAFARGGGRRLVFALAVVFAVIWTVPVGLFHAIEMIPFYWFGMCVFPRLLAMRWWKALGAAALALYLVATFSLGDFTDRGLAYHVTSMHIQDFSWRGLGLQIGRCAIGLAGACGGLLIVKALVERWPALERLGFFGSQTLGVFCLHMLLLDVYFARIGWTGGGLAGRLALAFLVFALSHFLVVLSRRPRWLEAVLWNPLSLRFGRRS